jgi:hypothetical protein
MSVMLLRAMPKELASRGVGNADDVCRGLATAVKGYRADPRAAAESPEDVFRRLGSS